LANLTAIPDKFHLVAFCDIVKKNAEQYNLKYSRGKASVFTDYQKLFSDISLDLIHICLPPFSHIGEVELAAENGIHIFIEKPIELNSKHAWQMVEAVENAGG
jgi:predicted dehydrogenase